MRELSVDVAIIGGGPAGLAAALEVARRGRRCAVLERNTELG
ncbi:MAG: FAD-dependent oxidoreductase, partial [Coriobacteriaceae bacterium]|nr:FAD-dependent oxidoreductase [Coriobacteriaceae bacterium]